MCLIFLLHHPAEQWCGLITGGVQLAADFWGAIFGFTVFAGAIAIALCGHLWGFSFCCLFERAIDSDDP